MSDHETPVLPFPLDGMLRLVRQNGWSLVLAVLFVVGMIGIVPRVETKLDDIKKATEPVTAALDTIKAEHQTMANVLSTKLDEQSRIQCATCWNGAASADEIRRCACDPAKR